ncbi:hypothetical protein [Actinoplanes sp. TFC3]|nr:hypothetical protein [Actinoplanes sp. TFC3]
MARPARAAAGLRCVAQRRRIYLRQRGSSQSKPVGSAHTTTTGEES